MRHKPQKLTDRFLQSLKPAKPGDRDDYPDTVLPGLVARVTDKGTKTFNLIARYPGSPNPTRRKVGDYAPLSDHEQQAAKKTYDGLPAKDRETLSLDQYLLRTYGPTTLAGAREKARRWKVLIAAGRDPALVEEQQRQAELQKQETTFGIVAEAWFKNKLPGERKGREVERDVRKAFVAPWENRPIAEIGELDVLAVINAKKAHAPTQARNLLGYAKRFFAWAKDQRVYGLETNPCADLRPSKLIGDKVTGGRVLFDDELFALWRAAKRLPYPYGPVYQTLILAALRLNEAARAQRTEFDLRNREWIIPAERMKGKNTGEKKARPHAVPLTDDLITLLNTLPRFNSGDYVFSTTFGTKPVAIGSKIKKQIDARMLRTLRALARRRGEDPTRVKLPRWKNHDIRRTVRSRLSRLKIAEEVREAVLAHVRPGIKGVYDLHDYLDEKREALELWAARLKTIVEPPPNNVVALRA
jgi:hypothetical protein